MGLKSLIEDTRTLLAHDRNLRRFMWRLFFWGTLGAYLVWTYVLKRPVYQYLYGKPTSQVLEVTDDHIIDIPSQPIQRVTINGFTIDVQLIKQFATTSEIVYIDRYSALGTWYRSNDGAYLYDNVVPLDISTVSGETAQYVKDIKFDHEYRFLSFSPGNTPYKNEDINNNHTIPATPNVQRGLDILRVGDRAYLEGYLIFWQGTGKYSYYRLESAIKIGQVSDYIVNGSFAGLCRQLYLTKIVFDGYSFE